MSVVDLLNYLRAIKKWNIEKQGISVTIFFFKTKNLRNKLYCDIHAFQKEEAKALEPL